MTHRFFWSTAAAAVLLIGASAAASAQELVGAMTPQEFFRKLGGIAPGAPTLKKFAYVPTPAPDAATHKCEVSSGKSLKVSVEPVYEADGVNLSRIDMDISFKSGSDLINPVSETLLRNLAQALNMEGLQHGTFAIAGHTDLQGNETADGRKKNLELSCARAIAVRNFLVQQGVDTTRLATYGFGPNRPLVPNVVKSDVNRRVEIRRAK